MFILQTKSSSKMYLFHPFQNEVWLLLFGVFFASTLCYLWMENAVLRVAARCPNKTMEKQGVCDRAVWYCVQIWLFQCMCSFRQMLKIRILKSKSHKFFKHLQFSNLRKKWNLTLNSIQDRSTARFSGSKLCPISCTVLSHFVVNYYHSDIYFN